MGQPSFVSKIKTWFIYTLAEIAVKCLGVLPLYAADPEGLANCVISATAVQYGYEELSKRKRQTYLQAEFPHLWMHIEKFSGGKTYYTADALNSLLGADWKVLAEDLLAIGFFSKRSKSGEELFVIPFLYRHGMNLTQGKA